MDKMTKSLELLEKYFRETPKEEIEKLFNEIDQLPISGPTPEEYFASLGGYTDPGVQDIQDEIKKWSDENFGSHRTGKPIAHHLKKEIDELIEAIDSFHKDRPYGKDKKTLELLRERRKRVTFELADCMMLLLDIASHEQITFKLLMITVQEKLEINKKRKWGEPDENGVVEHIPE